MLPPGKEMPERRNSLEFVINDTKKFFGARIRIRNMDNSLFLTVGENIDNDGEEILQKRSIDCDDPRYYSQVWYVFEVDKNSFMIVNVASGLVLSLSGNASTPKRIEQRRLKRDDNSQCWLFATKENPTRPDSEGLWRSMIAAKIHGYISTDCKTENTPVKLHVQRTKRDKEIEFRWWGFISFPKENVKGIDGDRVFRTFKNLTIDAFLMMNDYNQCNNFMLPKPDFEIFIPFVFINDDQLRLADQSKDNPYYRLHRSCSWRKIYFVDMPGISRGKAIQSTVISLIPDDENDEEKIPDKAKKIKDVIGIVFTQRKNRTEGKDELVARLESHQWHYIRERISKKFKMAVDTSYVGDLKKLPPMEEENVVFYPIGRRVVEAIWYREDHYVLEDVIDPNDSQKRTRIVLKWTIRNPGPCMDRYPPEGAAAQY